MVKFARSRNLALLTAGLWLAAGGLGHAKKKASAPRPRPRPHAVAPPSSGTSLLQPPAPVYSAPVQGIDMNAAIPAIPPQMAELPLMARGAIVVESTTGRVLYEKNADQTQFPASTTKIMTALLVIEEGDLEHQIEVDLADSQVGESGLDIRPGQHFTRREALYGLMLKSANDVAHALGRDNAGSIEAFAEKMTRRAHELGAQNASFKNPNGLHDPQHFLSPRDLVCIARAAMQQPLFRKIVSTQFASWPGNYGQVPLRNHNRMLWMYPGCIGVKTGYTNPSQQVLACAAQWGCNEAVSVIMHSDKPGIWNDSKLLLTFALGKLQAQ